MWRKNAKLGPLFKVANRKFICVFPLVINTNLPPILHRFQVMADCQIFASDRGRFTLTHSLGAIPCEHPETRGIVLPDAENRTIVSSFVWTQYRSVTDRRDRIAVASTALCIASHARTRGNKTDLEYLMWTTALNDQTTRNQ